MTSLGMPLSVLVLLAVLIMVVCRQVAGVKVKIWQIMTAGAIVVLISGDISLQDAAAAINIDVMLFLLGMFIVGEALHMSGYLFYLSHRLFRHARSSDQLVLLILFGMGGLSALLMNDTLAIIGTPLVLFLARVHALSPQLLLLALAFGVTTGSLASPIGNPQNLLIALDGGLSNPFADFLSYLLLPTALNLVLAYLVLRIFYHDQFGRSRLTHVHPDIADPHLARIAALSFGLVLILVLVKVAAVCLGVGEEFRLTYVALLSALPVLAASRRRWEVVRRVDWETLIFFASMFVLMESVWDSGFLQSGLDAGNLELTSIPVILAVSVVVSQLVSNVPFVALYLPILDSLGTSVAEMAALAAGSTIAGNLFILGAASNVIIIQNAEKSGHTVTFMEFARVGVPLTMANLAVYWAFLVWL
ncbi:MAG: Citrate transporter [Methanosaeta sp. PtaB.Bin039]|nr:MAG: Citrate transporter [Methanosaeta sp. PtaB.Bin039]OPY44755.1 MAG: Citrate transporter [Methanosaeta sp. PtaU1.Bin028]HOT07169.1 SLC13 family permease [Methanotrichaceae archaeon]HQF16890.1 SLC13 family permease [Methanotrichaceae archaeon]HQI91456.1 SLC13 family permease [Methanotrichaceae archaeon]